MRHRSLIARGLWLAVACLTAAPGAGAAQPRRKKAAKSADTKSADTKSADTKSADTKASEPKPAAPPDSELGADQPESSQEAEPKGAEPNHDASQPAPSVAATAGSSSRDDAVAAGSEHVELGRREAGRIAVGRVQVAVSVGVDIGSRSFTYSDPVGSGYAPYRQPVAPMLSFGVEAYPAAASDIPVLRDLGLRGRISRGFAFDSDTPQGVTLETSWTRFGGELRQRLIVPGAHRLEVGLLAGLDANYFGISADSPVPALLPAANTVALRFGVDGQLRLAWRLSILLGAAYLHVTSPGEIYEQFRKPHVAGVDGDCGFAVDLGAGFEARLNGRYTRYFASFDPQLGDAHVAGGALDQLLQVGLGARYAH